VAQRISGGCPRPLVALGEALERQGKLRTAARVYGSIIDLFPSRADLRRFAGNRLERLGELGRRLAIDTYRHAVEQRPDHPNSHRLYAYALLRGGQPEAAFDAIVAGRAREYPSERFAAIHRILREDVGLILSAWIASASEREAEIRKRANAAGATIPTEPSTRFVVSWETDANDVDFHVHDNRGGHAFYSAPALPSGGSLYADVTTGLRSGVLHDRRRTRSVPVSPRSALLLPGPDGLRHGDAADRPA
jgi:hypothetical protein